MKKIFLLAMILLLPAFPAFSKFDPAFTWSTLETRHFLIHYHQGEEEIANRTAILAEDVHDRLTPRIKWDPPGRTHIVLVDASDSANGMTSPFPYKHITLYLTKPVSGTGFGSTSFDEWMRLLLTHEYTHILHLDMVNGVPDFLQYLFGRIYFPNQWEPLWMIEGLATYEETEQTSGGRGRSPASEMVLRAAVLEDRFPRISQAAVVPDFWPAGHVPYLFGEGFTRYLVEKFGRDKVADISVSYSRHGIPWLVDVNGRWTLGDWYSDLWNEWRNELRTRYARVRDEVSARGLTASLPLTERGFVNAAPAFSPDGSRIAYTVYNNDAFPGIYLMNADGTGDRRLVDNLAPIGSSGGSASWSPDGNRIYYTKLDIENNTDLYNDIYYFDLSAERETRITRGLRARDPFPSPDGKKLLLVINKLGKNRLALLDLEKAPRVKEGEQELAWLSDENDNQYESPRFSPDGSMIVVGVWQPGGYKDIWLLDSSGRKIGEVGHDRATDGGATWSADGRFIYFTSDRTGIFNLFAYELESKKIFQITNVLGGAFAPALSTDGKALVFSSYTSKGFDLHLRQADPAAWRPAEPYRDPYPVMAYRNDPVETKSGPYNPLPTLVPRFWLPWYGASEASNDLWGFLTFGQDAVERHSYIAAGLYSPTTYRKWYAFEYAYDGLYPTLSFSAADVDNTFGDLLSDPTGSTDYVQAEQSVDFSVLFPLFRVKSQHALTLGYRRKEITPLTDLPPWPGYTGPVPAQGLLASGRIGYQFNNARRYGFSISPEDGRTIAIGYEKLDKPFGSDFVVSKYTADWHEYLPLPLNHHVLLARVFGGTSHGESLPQRAFQLGGDNPGDMTMPVDNQTIYLRGYPVNAFRGSKAALASLEYRFPIVDIEAGLSNAPVFFRRVHGAVFAEAGNAWDDGFHGPDFKRAVGAEARLDLQLAYYLPLTLRLVVADGLDEKGETSVYLSLWMPALL